MDSVNINRWKSVLMPHGLVYSFLAIVIVCLIILTSIYASLRHRDVNANAIANGIIGFPPLLPNDGRYVQWTFLHMNDVYELLPLNQGQTGGLARVAYLRQLLLNENKRTVTVLAGDLVSPSAIGTAIVNGTALNGKQMIATMNTLGLDYLVFGNHEFDLSESNLLARMNESQFTWICANIFLRNTSDLFGSSITHQFITIDTVRILLFGLTINVDSTYVDIINESSLVPYTQQFLAQFPNNTYDILVALTHLDITIDIELATNIPEIDLIMGGHEHEDYYLLRGSTYTPIYKADANAATVYIHRCAFNLDTRRFRIYSTLSRVSPEVPEEMNTAIVANYWFNLGIQGLEALGFQPTKVVSCLPANVQLDGRAEAVRSSQTLLSNIICESMIDATNVSGAMIGLFNSGAIRLDDILLGVVTQYDVMRTLPFPDAIVVLSVPGNILAQVLTTGLSLRGNGMFLSYTRVETFDQGSTWLFNGSNIATSGISYIVATLEYTRENTKLIDTNVRVVQEYNVTQAMTLINYLTMIYPPCK